MDEDVLVKQYPVPNPQNFEITQVGLENDDIIFPLFMVEHLRDDF